jgi:hypothetical protein
MTERGRRLEIWNISDRDYARDFGVIPSDFGPLIGEGLGHRVYEFLGEYADEAKFANQKLVLKVPKRRKWYPTATAKRRELDRQIVEAFFTENYIDTKILSTSAHSHYLVLQRRITDPENLTPKILNQDPQLSNQFEKTVNTNRQLVSAKGISLDFLGWNALKKTMRGDPQLSNLVLDRNHHSGPRLVITDTSLLRLEPEYHEGVLLTATKNRTIARFAFDRNQKIIKKHFGFDIGHK